MIHNIKKDASTITVTWSDEVMMEVGEIFHQYEHLPNSEYLRELIKCTVEAMIYDKLNHHKDVIKVIQGKAEGGYYL